jgi:SAM-dependent methyltransferase
MTGNYDRIARFYDIDMAQNMQFDDVGFYVRLAAQARGPVLELGCGNGRILLPLLRAGLDATGVDDSAGMLAELRRKAAAQNVAAKVTKMDVRDLDLRLRFALILCPYSLVTYVTEDRDLERLLRGVREHLRPDGRFIVDAFVPRPVAVDAEFRLDYRRPFGDGTLTRWKRISVASPATNCVERRYQIIDAAGIIIEEIDVREIIRPFAPARLRDAVIAARLVPEQEWWDYGTREKPEGAQFYTLMARASD